MSHFEKLTLAKSICKGRDEHITSSLCGVSIFLDKLSPAQHAYFKKASKVKIIAYADPECCFKGSRLSLADGRMLVGQLFELSGGGGGGGGGGEGGGQYLYS